MYKVLGYSCEVNGSDLDSLKPWANRHFTFLQNTYLRICLGNAELQQVCLNPTSRDTRVTISISATDIFWKKMSSNAFQGIQSHHHVPEKFYPIYSTAKEKKPF